MPVCCTLYCTLLIFVGFILAFHLKKKKLSFFTDFIYSSCTPFYNDFETTGFNQIAINSTWN